MKTWRLKKGEDRRFKSGHPWVFSNELQESPKGVEPGEPIVLAGPGGEILARGYGNPKSLIAFRALTRQVEGPTAETDPWGIDSIFGRLKSASRLRRDLGLSRSSHRLLFGEADGFPGLIIDRYRVVKGSSGPNQEKQVFVVQAHTAGADRLVAIVHEALLRLVQEELLLDWNDLGTHQTGFIIRSDADFRKLEGLTINEHPQLIGLEESDLHDALVVVPAASGEGSVFLHADLVGGQKTGFYLDQAANIRLFCQALDKMDWVPSEQPIRILDVCCYVGQWSAQMVRLLKAKGFQVEVTLADDSASALKLAKKNAERVGASVVQTLKGDALETLKGLSPNYFDIVIVDPPALIPNRKAIPQGKHAYLTLNTQALRTAKKGALVLSSSCSQLLDEDSFLEVLSKAGRRNHQSVRWTVRGGHAGDHPVLAEFPEGRYLKAWIGIVDHADFYQPSV